MKIISVNAEQELVKLINVINRSPESWRRWKTLHIHIDEDSLASEGLNDGVLVWAESILESCLKGIEGKAYFCHGRDIHILCREIETKVLEQIAVHTQNLLKEQDNLEVSWNCYELRSQQKEYINAVMNAENNLYSSELYHDYYQEAASKKRSNNQRFQLPWFGIQSLAPNFSDAKMIERKKVLLVEDDPVARWMVSSCLKKECELETMQNANQVFSSYSAVQPDVIFLDIDLPGANGHRILRWIMKTDPGAYVVMLSGSDDIENMTDAMAEGAKGFVSKPFVKEQLLFYLNQQANQKAG